MIFLSERLPIQKISFRQPSAREGAHQPGFPQVTYSHQYRPGIELSMTL